MDTPTPTTPTQPPRRRRTLLIVIGSFVLMCGLAAGGSAWWVKHNFYASPIRPVTLSAAEQQAFDAKLQALQTAPTAPRAPAAGEEHRTLIISQNEINGYLASQNLGDKVRVELDQGRITGTFIVPVPKDSGLPLVSGTTLRVMFALEAAMADEKKVSFKLSDVRVGGLSLPNAWLGDLKGVNLMAENVEKDPALQRFLAGIQEVEIRPEGLRVLLSE